MKNIDWQAPEVYPEALKTGDMPGDRIHIGESHIHRAREIFPRLLQWISAERAPRRVISVYGGSGVGKSEIASLLAFYLEDSGYPSYIMSGDNYPFLIPEENDSRRLEVYEKGGKEALTDYLGGSSEIDFSEVNRIISAFKAGDGEIRLKHMGRTRDSINRENHRFGKDSLLILEWTHGNNPLLQGVDYPIFLYSTPVETLEHRLLRARDKGADSPFVQLVLGIEQEKLDSQAPSAALIVSKNGEILSLDEFRRLKNG